MIRFRLLLSVLFVVSLTLAADPALAQEAGAGTALGGQSMRPFRFLFGAYAVAWLLVFGWVISVSRRLAGLERRLRE